MSASHVIPFSSSPENRSEKPYTVVISVTPEIAERWLAKNTHNRVVRPNVVDAYARDMAKGDWKLTGESIKWSVDQQLQDGQHRLLAIVKSGKTIQTFVTFNLPNDAQSAMDSGAKRTAGDALNLDGEKYSALLASTIRLAIAIETGGYENAGHYTATHAEIIDFLASRSGLREAAEFAGPIPTKTKVPPTVVAYTYWRLAQINQADAARFWNSAASKVGLVEGDPVIALTEKISDAHRNRHVLTKTAILSLIFRSWNAWRAGKTLRLLRINSTTGGLIPVPEPK
jgi:hypothetical protein